MGSVAQAKADKVIVTSDNPRSENSRKIIEDIVNGINSAVTIEVDRREAIILAISSASDNDVVLIAGKGHEKYQIIGSKKVHFSDKQEASLALEQRYCQSGGAA
jgi:UDP-N-acetylmuramoyl-L-alanyl-D-glutamate--2,6-diaminopimelate ligase